MLLVVDASVLIDYAKSDLDVLGMAARHLGKVHVPGIIVDEVAQIDASKCADLGITVVEATDEQIQTAAQRRPGLSFQDNLCLLLARQNGWTCVSNDKRLRQACADDGLDVMWGLQMMVELIERGQLDAAEALRVARVMQQNNPYGITDAVMARFRQRVSKLIPGHKAKRR